MAKKKVGLYLGVNSLGGVVVENRKITSLAKYDLSSLEEETKVENLNEEVKWEALINKTLRELKAEGKEIYVSLADRDFIFRSFEMPLMNKREIESSLNYEIEKYIPFKVEELMCDFSYVTFPREKKITISFVGIREGILNRNTEIFTRLGLEPVIVEPSSLSLVRVLKTMKGYANLKNFALLDFTENEAYLTFFYYDLPVFNRYFAIPKNEDGIDLEKFIEPIRLSFQYFQREFKSYELSKFIIIADSANEKLVTLLKEDLQTEIELVPSGAFTAKEPTYVESLKALGIANRDAYAYKFKPIFLKRTKEQLAGGKVIRDVPLQPVVIIPLLLMCAVIYFTMTLFWSNDIAAKQRQLQQEEDSLPVPAFLTNLTWDQRESAVQKKTEMTNTLRTLDKTFKSSSAFLNILPAILPEGLWLDSFVFNTETGKYKGSISGYAFLGDGDREREAIGAFISNMKSHKEVNEAFRDINLVLSQKTILRGFNVTAFSINME